MPTSGVEEGLEDREASATAFEVVVFVCVRCSSPNYITSLPPNINIMSDDPPPCTDLTTLAGCGYKGTPNSTLVGIIVGSVFGVLLLLLVIFCCRRERVLKVKTEEEEANLRRGSIAKIKESVDAVRDSTALKDMSNVSKGVLKRQIIDQLVIKKVQNDGSTGETKRESFLQSLSKSNRAYSSFAAAISTSSSNKAPTEFVEIEAAANDDVEKGEGNTTTITNDEALPAVDRRRSNAMARSLSIMLSNNKSDTSKCYLCLVDYVKGDEVAFSKNEKCTHRYHKDCIVEWCMKRKACPCCKVDFVESNTL